MDQKLRIGLIGTGNIGGALARHWAKAGHPLCLASRHPGELTPLARELAEAHGVEVQTGTAEDAATFGEVVLLSIPLGEVAKLSPVAASRLRGKIVLDTTNPYPERDGDDGVRARTSDDGSGAWIADRLPGARLVKAFNTIPAAQLVSGAFRQPDRFGVPLASDDKPGLETAARLVLEAGFDAVLAGPLAAAKTFDVGTPAYGQAVTARELRARLGDVRPRSPHFGEAHG